MSELQLQGPYRYVANYWQDRGHFQLLWMLPIKVLVLIWMFAYMFTGMVNRKYPLTRNSNVRSPYWGIYVQYFM